MDKSGSPNASRTSRRRRPRRGSRSASGADAGLRALTQQMLRLNKTLAIGRPTLNHPTFVGSESCKPGYTFTSITLKPPEIEKGSYFGRRLSLPDSVTDYDKKLGSRIQIRINPLPKFDSTVWVTVRKGPSSSDLSVAAISAMFGDGNSPGLVYQYAASGVKATNKLLYDLSEMRADIGDMRKYAVLVYSKDDKLEKDEIVLHVDVEHQRIPISRMLPT
ncbi:coat protein [Cucumber mosaic virus]|uniref:Capsid protein n=1 Tax=Cucumber mosaic virus TaxID=12305 RepID=Q8QXZ2_9BROM|nr:coat protein [Cucumber mosaic virus]CAC81741.1 coat protein [Cucumber mosaic virus]